MRISDFYKMIVTVIKIHYEKQKLEIIQYKNYNHFNKQCFSFEINNELIKIDINNNGYCKIKKSSEYFKN